METKKNNEMNDELEVKKKILGIVENGFDSCFVAVGFDESSGWLG